MLNITLNTNTDKNQSIISLLVKETYVIIEANVNKHLNT